MRIQYWNSESGYGEVDELVEVLDSVSLLERTVVKIYRINGKTAWVDQFELTDLPLFTGAGVPDDVELEY